MGAEKTLGGESDLPFLDPLTVLLLFGGAVQQRGRVSGKIERQVGDPPLNGVPFGGFGDALLVGSVSSVDSCRRQALWRPATTTRQRRSHMLQLQDRRI